MKTPLPKASPRRRSKFYADGSALVAVEGAGTLLIESQTGYKRAGSKGRDAKQRRQHLSNVLTTSVE
jgi:hypothetical protein